LCTQGYELFGFTRDGGAAVYREWAPAAQGAQLIGDFNGWQGTPLERDDFGVWSVRLPDGAIVSTRAIVITSDAVCAPRRSCSPDYSWQESQQCSFWHTHGCSSYAGRARQWGSAGAARKDSAAPTRAFCVSEQCYVHF